jgi:hypothetical protein
MEEYFQVKLIGLAGPKGVGKSTLIDFINDETTNDDTAFFVERLSFATPLKMACHILFGGEKDGWFGNDLHKSMPCENWGELLGEDYSTYRKILQTVGTEIFRNNVHKDFWRMVWSRSYDRIVAAHKDAAKELLLATTDVKAYKLIIIVDDVRFDNEAELINKTGGDVIRLSRVGYSTNDKHTSELGVSDFLLLRHIELRDYNHSAALAKAIVNGSLIEFI